MPRVVIRRYLDFVGAQLERTRLAGSGIRATAVESVGFFPNAGLGGGVALEVDEADVARAEALLADHGVQDDEAEDDPEDVRCPRCELEYTRFQKPPLPVGVVFGPILLVFAAVLRPFTRKRWYCSKCEYLWDDATAGPRRLTALPDGIPRPVFRLRRGSPALGLLLGGMIGLGASAGVALLADETGQEALRIPGRRRLPTPALGSGSLRATPDGRRQADIELGRVRPDLLGRVGAVERREEVRPHAPEDVGMGPKP